MAHCWQLGCGDEDILWSEQIFPGTDTHMLLSLTNNAETDAGFPVMQCGEIIPSIHGHAVSNREIALRWCKTGQNLNQLLPKLISAFFVGHWRTPLRKISRRNIPLRRIIEMVCMT